MLVELVHKNVLGYTSLIKLTRKGKQYELKLYTNSIIEHIFVCFSLKTGQVEEGVIISMA